jgi:hypothetical protein
MFQSIALAELVAIALGNANINVDSVHFVTVPFVYAEIIPLAEVKLTSASKDVSQVAVVSAALALHNTSEPFLNDVLA